MDSETVSSVLDKLLTNMTLASNSNQLSRNIAVEILTDLQLENHIDYFTMSHNGLINLLNICNSYNTDELDKVLLDILLAYVHRPESKSHQSKNRKILTNISEEVCHNYPSLSALLDYQSEVKSDLLETIDKDVIMDWIVNTNNVRINIVDLVINHSKKHWEYFTISSISCLSNITETNICLYLPLIKSLTHHQAKESKL